MEEQVSELIYNRSITCPVCEKGIEVTEIKIGKSKLERQDEDFCPHYKGINPLFYEIWVCPECGYAALSKSFDKIHVKRANTVKEVITPRWVKREFSGERDINKSLETYKLALITANVIKAKESQLANICMRISWMYRYMEDEKSEKMFLKSAVGHYEKAFSKESFPIDKLDEATLMYLLGEMNRRLGETEQATTWFSKFISLPAHMKKPGLSDKAREQWQLLRQENVITE